MNEFPKIEYVLEPSAEDLAILTQGISFDARKKKNQTEIKPYAYFLKNASNQIIGGINGCLIYGSLYIDQLWIDESVRGKGYGKQLMQKAELLGLENHCRFATVHTMDWEAKDFYTKLGYTVEFQSTGYDNHSTCYFLKKVF